MSETKAETKTYAGSCHCGAVRFQVTMEPPEKAYSCNCSICRRAGWLLGFAPVEQFSRAHDEGAIADYQFGKKKIHHYFCKTCGVRAYSRGVRPDGAPVMALNLRCLDGIDVDALPVHKFDGASI